MKCRVCCETAAVDVRRHNSAFCRTHFLAHCQEQVRRAIDGHDMFGRDDRILVAVSGGKDSLMLWDVLLGLGYRAEGMYIGLGIGEYSDESRERSEKYAADRGVHLEVVDLAGTYGYDIPTGSRAARRSTCGTCGLSKRYVMNDVARRGGYDVLATGHNLDDEAAVLFGNLLHWNVEALGRQRPVLPATDGFVRKVKPLIRLAERETAAYAVLAGIDYIVEECPMVAGNTGLRYKDALAQIEATSPGTKGQLYGGFLEHGLPRFAGDADEVANRDVHACDVRRPDHRGGVRLLPAACPCDRPRTGCHRGRRSDAPSAAQVLVSASALAEGDLVMLLDRKGRRYLLDLVAGGMFHSHAGIVLHDDVMAAGEGGSARSSTGQRYTVLRPTLSEFVLKMKRRAQVVYPKDLGAIVMLADIFPGAHVVEAGVGSGALTMTLLRAVGERGRVTSYEIREDHAEQALRNLRRYLGETPNHTLRMADVAEELDEDGIDRIVLDLPEPWRVAKAAAAALRPGGIILTYLPTVPQVQQVVDALTAAGFGYVQTLEVLHRGWTIDGLSVRPDHRMVADTAFLTVARLLAPEPDADPDDS